MLKEMILLITTDHHNHSMEDQLSFMELLEREDLVRKNGVGFIFYPANETTMNYSHINKISQNLNLKEHFLL